MSEFGSKPEQPKKDKIEDSVESSEGPYCKVYQGVRLSELFENEEILKEVASAYEYVYGTYWKEEYKPGEVEEKVRKNITEEEKRIPIATFLDNFEGFSFSFLISSRERIKKGDMPPKLLEEEKEKGVNASIEWLRQNSQENSLFIKDLGQKEIGNPWKVYSLIIPVLNKAQEEGYNKALLGTDKVKSPIFKIAMALGGEIIHNFLKFKKDEETFTPVLMALDIKKTLQLLSDVRSEDKDIKRSAIHTMRKNIKESGYFD